ncbi:MAG: hypothetical protein CM1200mP20_14330 [Pseudomonadota bacterium]|nr:MAG: hypothetical protein CM1200mP20_14330 [Pseudomonadota bacterium]
MISILLLQDFFAIAALLVLHGISGDGLEVDRFVLLVLALPLLLLGGLAGERWLLRPLFHKFDKIGEYVFLLTLGWCLGLAQLAQALGLSYEMGAFIAGVTIANSPIAPYIADSLRPLRDFFLIMFFFALGAGLDFSSMDGSGSGAGTRSGSSRRKTAGLPGPFPVSWRKSCPGWRGGCTAGSNE